MLLFINFSGKIKKKPVKYKKSNFEKGIEIVCQKFDSASQKEMEW